VASSTSRTLSEILAAGVAGEGGAKNAYVAGYRVAAKTGTSEKKGQTTTGEEMYICSCVGYAPADDPQYALLIMVDEPTRGLLYGSTVAAPYIARTFEAVLPYLGVEPIYTEAEQKLLASNVPNYVGLETQSAVSFAREQGLEVAVVGEGEYVISQSPKAGSMYHGDNGKMVFYTDDQKVAPTGVPDVVGKTLVEANRALAAAGLNIKITGTPDVDGTGSATVVSQLPLAGSTASLGDVVSIELRYMTVDE
jgi:stage V sporulation protein D (sporulation-specific penicillin-binding protein)